MEEAEEALRVTLGEGFIVEAMVRNTVEEEERGRPKSCINRAALSWGRRTKKRRLTQAE